MQEKGLLRETEEICSKHDDFSHRCFAGFHSVLHNTLFAVPQQQIMLSNDENVALISKIVLDTASSEQEDATPLELIRVLVRTSTTKAERLNKEV